MARHGGALEILGLFITRSAIRIRPGEPIKSKTYGIPPKAPIPAGHNAGHSPPLQFTTLQTAIHTTKTTTAQTVATLLGDDGQVFTTADGRTFDDPVRHHRARVEYGGRDYLDNPDTGEQVERFSRCPQSAHMAGDPVRYVFPDRSVIVCAGDGWDDEGGQPV